MLHQTGVRWHHLVTCIAGQVLQDLYSPWLCNNRTELSLDAGSHQDRAQTNGSCSPVQQPMAVVKDASMRQSYSGSFLVPHPPLSKMMLVVHHQQLLQSCMQLMYGAHKSTMMHLQSCQFNTQPK